MWMATSARDSSRLSALPVFKYLLFSFHFLNIHSALIIFMILGTHAALFLDLSARHECALPQICSVFPRFWEKAKGAVLEVAHCGLLLSPGSPRALSPQCILK